MVFEFSPQALSVMNDTQRTVIADGFSHWNADKVVVHDDGECRPGGIHGDGHMLLAMIYREREKVGAPIFVAGVMPNGDMHS